ncbi:MAG: polysaccharide ABC transporter ATP-binding protein [Rickettsiales bacterium]
MHEPLAISLEHVSKSYRLYGSQREQLCDVLGLTRLGLARPSRAQEFKALEDVSLQVPRGHRIGIIGRNGAGKTTLLKLICGNFAPSAGKVTVNGSVQALMQMGLGFHPEFTGLENLRASLQYNGLATAEYEAALADIIAFCELGDFIDQPFKTYSLGMQARLMFAAATAIRPDILIIDEVLGAGDAYFIAKSRQRVERLVNSGATMLLVSHSTQQVLELCNEAIWMHEGKIRMQGDAFSVVKAYEAYIHNPSLSKVDSRAHVVPPSDIPVMVDAPSRQVERQVDRPAEIQLQDPCFQPHTTHPAFPSLPADAYRTMQFEALGGISRWECDRGVKITGFTIRNSRGQNNELRTLEPVAFTLFTQAEITGTIACRYGIAIHDYLGNCVTRIFSAADRYEAIKGQCREITLMLNPNQLGPGDYTLGISINSDLPLEMINTAARYDLLSRSFAFRIVLPDSLNTISSAFFHSGEWDIRVFERSE